MRDLRAWNNINGVGYQVIDRRSIATNEQYFEALKYNPDKTRWNILGQFNSLSDCINKIAEDSNSMSFTVEFADF